ncbi:U-box-domain-containing protein [Xylariomycetidae sp. FL0641]|nr:U-box-domain-containing protein [Xylariomycetidae sp. FL0641]
MPQDSAKAARLKDLGNGYYKQGDYVGAESQYSKAILADNTNPALYTNRAMARLRLELFETAVADCNTCLELSGSNMKAHFILSQALLPLGDYEGALKSAQKAHRLCTETADKSMAQVTNQVLRCKKERWEYMEKKRAREGRELEAETIGLMERERDEMLCTCHDDLERRTVREEWDQKIDLLKSTFEKARAASERKREVPDWAIDDIGFGLLVDPVMTKTGKSYERASLMEHLRRSPTDPLTREPLTAAELRPNLGLREAVEDFVEQNGWAADW